jgi:hypothetical protein
MTTIATNLKNDIFLDEIGNLSILEGLPAITQVCEQVSRTLTGEMQYNITSGLPYYSTVWEDSKVAEFENSLIKNITEVDGVISIQNVEFSQAADVLSYQVKIFTPYGASYINGALNQ